MRAKITFTLSSFQPALGTCISCDYVKMTPNGKYGYVGYWILIEHASGFIWQFIVKSKDEFIKYVEIVRKILLSNKFILQHNIFDAGTVENSSTVMSYLEENRIIPRPAAPNQQNQNDVERTIQTFKDNTSTLMTANPHLDADWWIYANISQAAAKTRHVIRKVEQNRLIN